MHTVHSVCFALSALEPSNNVINTHRQFLKLGFCYTNESEECDMSQTNESYKAKINIVWRRGCRRREFQKRTCRKFVTRLN